MTLILASVGLVTESATATWWNTRETAYRKSSRATLQQSNAYVGTPRRHRTLGMALFTLVAVGLAFLLNDVRLKDTLPFQDSAARVQQPQSSAQDRERHRAYRDYQRLFSPQSDLQSMESSLPSKDVFVVPALAYQSKLFNQVSSLLDSDQIGMLNLVHERSQALDLAIELEPPASVYRDSSVSPKPERKPRSAGAKSRLARVTVYWPEEGDFYTGKRQSSTGVRLRDGHCAVDPKVIPYGSVVNVPGVGSLVAVDTGSAVKSRRAARAVGRTLDQRKAIVIDIFCSSRSKARALMKRIKHFAVISWQQPQRFSEL